MAEMVEAPESETTEAAATLKLQVRMLDRLDTTTMREIGGYG